MFDQIVNTQVEVPILWLKTAVGFFSGCVSLVLVYFGGRITLRKVQSLLQTLVVWYEDAAQVRLEAAMLEDLRFGDQQARAEEGVKSRQEEVETILEIEQEELKRIVFYAGSNIWGELLISLGSIKNIQSRVDAISKMIDLYDYELPPLSENFLEHFIKLCDYDGERYGDQVRALLIPYAVKSAEKYLESCRGKSEDVASLASKEQERNFEETMNGRRRDSCEENVVSTLTKVATEDEHWKTRETAVQALAYVAARCHDPFDALDDSKRPAGDPFDFFTAAGLQAFKEAKRDNHA